MSDLQEALSAHHPAGPSGQDRPRRHETQAPAPAGRKAIRIARAVKASWRAFIPLGIMVVLLGGAALPMYYAWPRAYDPDELKKLYEQGQQLVDVPPIDHNASDETLVAAKERLQKGIAVLDGLQFRLAQLKKYQASDSRLAELAHKTDLQMASSERSLQRVMEQLWPGPGDMPARFQRLKASVPLILCKVERPGGSAVGMATAFLIKPHAMPFLLVTNRHVVKDAENGFTVLFLIGSQSQAFPANAFRLEPDDVLWIHRHEDLAVLRLPDSADKLIARLELHPLELGRSLAVGDEVWAIGHPGAGPEGPQPHTLVKGNVAYIKPGEYGYPLCFHFTAPVNPGNSGGPVLDARGRVVGVVSRSIEGKSGMNYAVHYRLIEQLIEDPRASLSKHEIALIVNPRLREAEETETPSREE